VTQLSLGEFCGRIGAEVRGDGRAPRLGRGAPRDGRGPGAARFYANRATARALGDERPRRYRRQDERITCRTAVRLGR